jgi:hypothetical protein
MTVTLLLLPALAEGPGSSGCQEMFPKGATCTSIIDLARKLVNGTGSFCYAKIQCAVCNAEMLATQPDNLMYIHSRAKSVNLMNGLGHGKRNFFFLVQKFVYRCSIAVRSQTSYKQR